MTAAKRFNLEDKIRLIVKGEKVKDSDVRDYLGEFISDEAFEKVLTFYRYLETKYTRMNMTTDSGDPALIHIVRVMKLVQYDPGLMLRAGAHDDFEDTALNIEDTEQRQITAKEGDIIRQQYIELLGEEVGDEVFLSSISLSKLQFKNILGDEYSHLQKVQRIRYGHYVDALQDDDILVKQADGVENTQTIGKCRVEKQKLHPKKIKKILDKTKNKEIPPDPIKIFYAAKLRYRLVDELFFFLESESTEIGKRGEKYRAEEEQFEHLRKWYEQYDADRKDSFELYILALQDVCSRCDLAVGPDKRRLGDKIVENEYFALIERTMKRSPPFQYSLANLEMNLSFIAKTFHLLNTDEGNQNLPFILLNNTYTQLQNDMARVRTEIENSDRTLAASPLADQSMPEDKNFDYQVFEHYMQLSKTNYESLYKGFSLVEKKIVDLAEKLSYNI
jgi:hypothetical protein